MLIYFISKACHWKPVSLFVQSFNSLFLCHNLFLWKFFICKFVCIIKRTHTIFLIIKCWSFKTFEFTLNMTFFWLTFNWQWYKTCKFYSLLSGLFMNWMNICFQWRFPLFLSIIFFLKMLSSSKWKDWMWLILVYNWLWNMSFISIKFRRSMSRPFRLLLWLFWSRSN